MKQAIEEFLLDMKMQGRSQWTVAGYRTALAKFTAWCQENEVDYRALTPRQARAFRNYLAGQGSPSPRTVNVAISALRSFYDYLLEEGVVTGNPVVSRRLRIAEAETVPRYLTDEEVSEVLAYADKHLPSASLPFRVMLFAGLRVSEVVNLTAADVVTRSGRVMLRVNQGKGRKDRYAPVVDQDTAAELVRLARKKRREGRNVKLFGVARSTLVAYAAEIKRETGVDFSTHRMRHTFATRLLAAGERLDVIQKILGHRDISTTTRYTTTLPEAWERLAAKVV
jgi:site-specific recombinase XerD